MVDATLSSDDSVSVHSCSCPYSRSNVPQGDGEAHTRRCKQDLTIYLFDLFIHQITSL